MIHGDTPAGDVAVIGGRVLRPGGEGEPPATAVAVRGGRVLRVGTDEEVRAALGPTATVIEAEGGTILPGFDDAHTHVLSGAGLRELLRLSPEHDFAELAAAIGGYAARTTGWIAGSGWHYRSFGGATPTRGLLDELTGGRPAYITAFDGHTSWVSSKALELAGVTRATPDPEGGVIDRDRDGEPTGILREKASALIHGVLERPRGDELVRLAAAAMRDLAASGITSVQDPGVEPEELGTWRALRDSGGLAVRARLGLPLTPDLDERSLGERLDEYTWRLAEVADGTWISGGTLKGFVDGVVETRTAAMLAPYEGVAEAGEPFFEPDRLTALVVAAARRGWQVQLHAIGDRAVRLALDAYEGARRAGSALRHRVEHIEVCDPADIPRFGELGAIASIQPLHAFCDPDRVAAWDGLVGRERSALAWPAAQILAAGGTVALGSDWPVADCAPLAILRAAVTQSNLTPEGPAAVPNSLTLRQALAAYTAGSAAAAGAGRRRGALTPGTDADLAVLSVDLTGEDATGEEAAGRLDGARVIATVAAGRITHRC